MDRVGLALVVALLASVGVPGGAGARTVAPPVVSSAAADGSGFSDVAVGSQFYVDISWLAASGITAGFADGTFRGASSVSRQAMAAFLFRFENYRATDPVCTAGVRKFTDVGIGGFCGPIEWLADPGIVSGYPDGTFRPGAAVSRQAMAAFLFRASGQAGSWVPPTTPSFSDVPKSSPFFSEIEWLASTGISTGYQDGTFRPGAAVSRQAMAAFLHRLHDQPFNNNGTVWAWGDNRTLTNWTPNIFSTGALGAGTTQDVVSVPSRTVGLTDVTAVAPHWNGGFALRSDGSVWEWGGELNSHLIGTDGQKNNPTPVRVPGLSDVTAITADADTAYALKSDGTVWAWGSNLHGQLGTGGTQDSADPVQVAGLTGVSALTASSATVYALKEDGTVWAWGSGGLGALGNASVDDAALPVQVSGLTDARRIIAVGNVALAIRADGTVSSWGSGGDGLIGNGAWADRTTPAPVTGLTQVTDLRIGCGDEVGCTAYALRDDGTVWFWGRGEFGRLGDGTDFWSKATPAAIQGLSGVTAISTFGMTGYALMSDATVRAWGWVPGGGTEMTQSAVPVQIPGLTAVTAISASYFNGFATKADGTLWSWGSNGSGELGNGRSGIGEVAAAPVQVLGIRHVISIPGRWNGPIIAIVNGSVGEG